MEGRLTAPPEIGCSHGSSSSRAYHKDDSSGSGTSSPVRSNSSHSSSASDDSLRRCSVSREDCNSSPDGTVDDVNRQLLNILVTANNGEMLMTDSAVASLKNYFKHEGLPDDAISRLRATTNNASCQTDPDSSYPPLVQIIRNPSWNSGITTFADIASTSNVTEGVLPLVIRNFSQMTETMRGPIMGIRGVPWRIMVMPRQHVVQKKGTQKCLGFFLQCCPTAYSDNWSCQANAELRLISQKPDVPNFTRKTSHSYTAKENDWGYSCFMTWADILDESQGYIKENTVKVEVSVKAEEPVNILNHDQFQKKIQDYIRLAEIQAQRGYLDKAIEVNTSATKFCKDKDFICQSQLEEQRKILIEKKLKQSIERIEKGTSNSEDNPANVNALRQAMGGGSAARAQKAQKVVKKETEVASKEVARKALAVRPGSKFDMRLEKQYRQATKQQQEKVMKLHEAKLNAAKASQNLAMKTNGSTNKALVAGGRFSESVTTTKNGIHRAVFTNENTEDSEDSITATAENGTDPDVFFNDNELSVHFSGEGHTEFNAQIVRVLEHLKEMNPNFNETMRKTFQNPSAMSFNEADSFLEEFYGGPASPNAVRECSVQTEELLGSGDFNDAAIVDAAQSKSLPDSPEDKRKVKRAQQSQSGDGHKSSSVADTSEEKLDDFNEPSSPSVGTSNPQPGNSQMEPQINFEEVTEFINSSVCYFQPLPMGNVFEYIERTQDVDNPERPGTATTGKAINSMEFVDHLMRQNIVRLVSDISHSGRPLHVGVDSNIFKTFPGYCPSRPLGQFEQRLIITSLNMMSVNCMNFANIIQKLYKFFASFNIMLVKSNLPTYVKQLEMTIKGSDQSSRTQFTSDPPKIPQNAIEISAADGIDCVLEKSCRKLHEFMVAEMRYMLRMMPGFNPVFNEVIAEAIKAINSLKESNETLKQDNEEERSRQQKLEQKKEHEINEIRNSSNGDKDKIAELTKQLREAKKETKKFERRCKLLETDAVDNKTLKERCEKADEKLTELTLKFNELSAQFSREKQSWQDSKANMVRDRQTVESELKTLRLKEEEMKSQIHKLEQQCSNEKKTYTTTLKVEKDRSIEAECTMLRTVYEYGMKTLERAHKDCKTNVEIWEKRGFRSEAEQDAINKNITAWKDKAEEIKGIIANTKAEFARTFGEIKKGKALSTLPKFVVPAPPPQPDLVPMPQPVATGSQSQPLMSVSGGRRSPIAMASASFVQPTGYPEGSRQLISPSGSKNMTASSSTSRGSITPQPMNPYRNQMISQTQQPAYAVPPHTRSSSTVGIPQPQKTAMYPIGVRPPNYKNGVNVQTPKDNIDNAAAVLAAQSSSISRQPSRTSPVTSMFNSPGAQDVFPSRPVQSTMAGNRWYDPLNAYNDFLPVDPNRWNFGDFNTMTTNRNNAMSPSLAPDGSQIQSAAIGSNRPRPPTWFDANNSPVTNRPS
uniref:MATH domain-containing protein n=1 Tax=Panagrolaimus sp. JU765 TaxID=591449 RepID=A0AC34QBY2_9BILA